MNNNYLIASLVLLKLDLLRSAQLIDRLVEEYKKDQSDVYVKVDPLDNLEDDPIIDQVKSWD